MILSINFSIVTADALDFASDALVLKFAQAWHGVDAAAARLLRLAHLEELPSDDGFLIVRNAKAVASSSVLFVDVPPIRSFGYQQMREFCIRALTILRAELPETRHLTLTLHGAGYGLDELEALDCEIDGIVQAVAAGSAPSQLSDVTFVERDARRAERLRAHLAGIRRQTLGNQTLSHGPGAVPVNNRSATKASAFIAMPFASQYNDRYHYGIAPPIHRSGRICERMDQLAFTGDVVAVMKERIESAELVVADVSGRNPNVYLEVGYAWALRTPTILLCEVGEEPIFDVRGHRYIKFESIRDLELKLNQELDGINIKGANPSAFERR